MFVFCIMSLLHTYLEIWVGMYYLLAFTLRCISAQQHHVCILSMTSNTNQSTTTKTDQFREGTLFWKFFRKERSQRGLRCVENISIFCGNHNTTTWKHICYYTILPFSEHGALVRCSKMRFIYQFLLAVAGWYLATWILGVFKARWLKLTIV